MDVLNFYECPHAPIGYGTLLVAGFSLSGLVHEEASRDAPEANFDCLSP